MPVNVASTARAALLPLLFVLTAAASITLGGCAPSACEQRRQWRNESGTTCQTCQTMECASERRGVVEGPFACAPEFACASRCAEESATTCGCVEACLRTADCRTRFDALVACAVLHCGMPCR